MDMITVKKEYLVKIVKEMIGTAPDSIMTIMADKLETEGYDSVFQYLSQLHRACMNSGFGPYSDEYVTTIMEDCVAITDVCERKGW